VIDIRQQFKTKTPDAIIGATALVHGFDMVTHNVDDFRSLDLNILTLDLK